MVTCRSCETSLPETTKHAGRCPACGAPIAPSANLDGPQSDSHDSYLSRNEHTSEDASGLENELASLEATVSEAVKHAGTPPSVGHLADAAAQQSDEGGPEDDVTATIQQQIVVRALADNAARSIEPGGEGEGGGDDDFPGDDTTATYVGAGVMPASIVDLNNTLQLDVATGDDSRKTIKTGSSTVDMRGTLVIKPRTLKASSDQLAEGADYELLSVIGEGGIGVVYAARQASIDRTVAVKMLNTQCAADEDQKQKFLVEAVVTGELEHPNIVPVYDLGENERGALFYSMKRVQGKPWNSVIHSMSLQENLETFMKVADAVAFAHSRNVIHRDLKPENVMLGDFGEVLVMDWGLALSAEDLHAAGGESQAVGGTPAYMAPEMAVGPASNVSVASDVYLLGANLYEIVTGRPPHVGKTVMGCLLAAAKNEIRPTEQSGELLDIAVRAMATVPEERFLNVQSLQSAIREYQSHSESILLAERADHDLDRALTTDDYEDFARSLFGFQEATVLWSQNSRAAAALSKVKLCYAQSALKKGDFDLGLSLLDAADQAHVALRKKILKAQRDRDARQKRDVQLKRIAAWLAFSVFFVVIVAFVQIRAERDRAIRAEAQAEQDRDKAQKSRIAESNLREQESQLRERKQYEAYIAQIGLAAAKIEENAFGFAGEVLEGCQRDLRHWEWGRLMHLCQQSERSFIADGPVDSVAFSPDGNRMATGSWNGIAGIWDVVTGELLVTVPHGNYVHAVAFSPDAKYLATGSDEAEGEIKIWDAATGTLVQTIDGHTDSVLSVAFSRDGTRLLSSSYDNTARLWDIATGDELRVFRGHNWWVWSAAFSPDEQQIVTASQDGAVIVWKMDGSQSVRFKLHQGPVYAAAFSPDGRHVASGGHDKRVIVWRPEEVRPFDFSTIFEKASGAVDGEPTYLILKGHTAPVRSVAFSADGNRVLSGSHDNTVKLWSADTGTLLQTLRGHAGWVRAAVFSPDGRRVLSGGYDQRALIWDLAGYEEKRVLSGHDDAVLTVAFSPDGTKVVTGSRDRKAKIWDLATGSERLTIVEGHEFLASSAAFFPDGQSIVTAAFDNTLSLWDVATGTERRQFAGTGRSAAVAISHDGRWLLTGSNDKSAKLWDVTAEEEPHELKGHRSEVTAVAFSHDDRLLFTGDARGRGRLWDAATREELWRLEGHTRKVVAACFLPGGKRLLTASADNTVAQWDVETGQELLSLVLKHPDAVTSMACTSDGRRALTACADGRLRLWLVETAEVLQRIDLIGKHNDGDRPLIKSVAISPDDRFILAADSHNASVRVWNLESGDEISYGTKPQEAAPFLDVKARGGAVWSALFSPDGKFVLTVGGEHARLWDFHSRSERARFSRQGAVASANFSPDGSRIVTGSWDTTAKIWNANTGKAELTLFGGHSGHINSAVFSPDGTHVLTASDDKTAKLWNAHTGEVVQTYLGHDDSIRSAVFSPDGKRVLTASHDKTARIWDTVTGEQLTTLSEHKWAVWHAVFSSDGRYVLTGSQDTTAKLWDADTGEVLLTLTGHTASVSSVALSPDGRRVLTGSQDTTAKLWDAQTGEEILTLKGHQQDITSVAFSADGRYAVTGSSDGTAILWLAIDWRTVGE